MTKPAAEATLSQIEERYRILWESSSDAIMTLEPPTWKFTSGNPATVKMFNCKSEPEFISLGPWELSPQYQPDGQLSADKAKAMIEQAMKEGSNFFEWTHKRYQGEDFAATVLLTKVKLGGREFLQATVRDVSALKRAESRYQELFNSIKDGIVMVGMKGKIIECNQAYLKMLGYDNEAIKKATYMQLTPKKWHQLEADIVRDQVMTRGYSDEYEKEYIRKDGTIFPISIMTWLVRDIKGNASGMWAIVRDITDKKKATEALQTWNRELERMNKYMVDRELKMAELKKENEELKKKLKVNS